ncbi:MAG: CBS domain-containing protein [Acidobacteriota bacterium]
MKVRDVLHTKGSQVHAVDPDASIQDVVDGLMAHRIGALLVIDRDGITRGIVTERDVLRECVGGAHRLHTTPVYTAMTADLVVGVLDDDIDEALGMMTRHRIRHLPVMDGGRVAGLVSIGDLVKACLDETASENGFLKEYIHGR